MCHGKTFIEPVNSSTEPILPNSFQLSENNQRLIEMNDSSSSCLLTKSKNLPTEEGRCVSQIVSQYRNGTFTKPLEASVCAIFKSGDKYSIKNCRAIGLQESRQIYLAVQSYMSLYQHRVIEDLLSPILLQ